MEAEAPRDRTAATKDGVPAAFAAMLVAAAFGTNLVAGGQYPGVDFWHARIVPIALRAGVDGSLYDRPGRERVREVAVSTPARSAQERLAAGRDVAGDERFLGYPGIETVASPLLFAAMAPFSTRSYDADQRAFRIVCLLSFYVSVLGLCLLAGYPAIPAAVAAGTLGLVYEPLLSELRVANVNLLQLGMMTAFLALQRRGGRARDLASGIVLATAVLFKPNLAPVAAAVACAWACARRWRPLVHLAAGALAGTGLALAAGTAALGTARPWADWLGVLPELLESPRTLAEGNFAVTGLLRAAFGVDLSPWLAVAFLVAIAAAARRRPGTVESDDAAGALAFERTYLAVGLGAAAMVLSARLVWLHYLVLALPLVVFLLRPTVPGAERRLPRGGALAAALGLTTGPKLLFIDGVGAVMGYAIAIALATAALFALGIAELRRLAGAGATSRTA